MPASLSLDVRRRFQRLIEDGFSGRAAARRLLISAATGVRLTRIDPAQNMRRFYRLALQPDLFGGCTLILEWGRIGRGGQVKLEGFDSEGQAVDAPIAMRTRKARRGYGLAPSEARV